MHVYLRPRDVEEDLDGDDDGVRKVGSRRKALAALQVVVKFVRDDVVEGDIAVPQTIREHGIADDVFGEDGAACAHEGDFRHDVTLLCLHPN